jgi:ADP-heptose:LPS heptosyltransferase
MEGESPQDAPFATMDNNTGPTPCRCNESRRRFLPKRVLLRNQQCPGDVLMLTAAVRDLFRATGGELKISVQTSCSALWENNPYIVPFDDGGEEECLVIDCEYPSIHQSNGAPYHFIHGFARHLEEELGLRIPLTEFRGDIHISDRERSWMSQIEELGIRDHFWIIIAGGKHDFTAKWWDPARFQRVVDHFRGRITFVQCGERGHWHPPLDGVINLIGKTDLRQFIRLVYHSTGVLCPVTFAMHAAAAVPIKPGHPPARACVVVAGGREPAHWEAYPNHRFLSTQGSLSCCASGGCWKSRCQLVGDGDAKDVSQICEMPVQLKDDLRIARCMDLITADDVIRAIESYYAGGTRQYNAVGNASC